MSEYVIFFNKRGTKFDKKGHEINRTIKLQNSLELICRESTSWINYFNRKPNIAWENVYFYKDIQFFFQIKTLIES